MTKLDRFIDRHTVLIYSVTMPIAAALGVLMALAIWVYVFTPLSRLVI